MTLVRILQSPLMRNHQIIRQFSQIYSATASNRFEMLDPIETKRDLFFAGEKRPFHNEMTLIVTVGVYIQHLVKLVDCSLIDRRQ